MRTTIQYHRQRELALVFFFTVGCVNILFASPTTDLASTNQEVRAAAAKILLQSYVAPPLTNWDTFVSKLKPGISMASALETLGQITNNVAGGVGSSSTEMNRYRLDDLWILECYYDKKGTNTVLNHLNFIQGLRSVDVEPPARYSGVWTDYYVNGQKSDEGYYYDGKLDGNGVGFHSDGKTNLIHHWVNGVSDGEEICFYPSGKIQYRGSYKTNSQVGTWIWYNEDGTVQLKRDYPQP